MECRSFLQEVFNAIMYITFVLTDCIFSGGFFYFQIFMLKCSHFHSPLSSCFLNFLTCITFLLLHLLLFLSFLLFFVCGEFLLAWPFLKLRFIPVLLICHAGHFTALFGVVLLWLKYLLHLSISLLSFIDNQAITWSLMLASCFCEQRYINSVEFS